MLPHAISDFFLEFNSYQKIFSIRYELKNKLTSYTADKH